MSEQNDAIIRQASKGDAQAISSLLEDYLPGLRAFLKKKAGGLVLGKESTTDLAQSVCRDILENLDRFHFGGAEGFRAWLYTTAQRKIADRYEFYRAQKRNVMKEEAVSPSVAELLFQDVATGTPSRHVEAREEFARFEDAFQELPEDQREVIQLAKFVGLSRKEIAERMDRSEGAVRTLLCRALANLAQILDPDDDEE